MEIYVYWFLMALLLLGLEMATGTFYLLVLSVSMMVGGFAGYHSASLVWQLMLIALTAVAGVFILRRWKSGPVKEVSSASLDIGQPVQILQWHENGTARVFYRGAEWDAELASADIPRDGALYIAAMKGSILVLTTGSQISN